VRDKEKILLKLRSMKSYVDFLKSHKKTAKEELERNYLLRSAIERNFQLALECVLDIGEMIISMEEFRKPEDYKDVIEILGKEGILPEKFAKKFAPAASFRNILVHKYAEIDLGELHKNLQKLGDLDVFACCAAKYLEKK